VVEIEVKKTLLLYLPLLIIMVTDPTYAQHYSKDFLEQGNTGGWSSSLKTWDEEWAWMLVKRFIRISGLTSGVLWLSEVSGFDTIVCDTEV